MGEEWRTLDLSFGCDQFWLRPNFKMWVMMMLLLSHLLALLTSPRERERELLNIQVSHQSFLGKEKWV
jgi:hypothetical protein